jgi:formylmethanofuran dehydrogenase subunit E
MPALFNLLEQSAALHRHLCPRQVLGARMSLYAGEWLALPVPQTDKRLLVIVETDGCFTDGVAVAANCRVGRRTMRVVDYGKVAATFVDTLTEQAVRLAPHPAARQRAFAYAPEASNKWEAQLIGYQHMPADELLVAQPVQLGAPVAELVSRPGLKAHCEVCNEEIMNGREVRREGALLCRACAAPAYYALLAPAPVFERCVTTSQHRAWVKAPPKSI